MLTAALLLLALDLLATVALRRSARRRAARERVRARYPLAGQASRYRLERVEPW